MLGALIRQVYHVLSSDQFIEFFKNLFLHIGLELVKNRVFGFLDIGSSGWGRDGVVGMRVLPPDRSKIASGGLLAK